MFLFFSSFSFSANKRSRAIELFFDSNFIHFCVCDGKLCSYLFLIFVLFLDYFKCFFGLMQLLLCIENICHCYFWDILFLSFFLFLFFPFRRIYIQSDNLDLLYNICNTSHQCYQKQNHYPKMMFLNLFDI